MKITYADNISDAQRKVIALFNKEHQGEIEVVPIDLPFSKFSTNERKGFVRQDVFEARAIRIDVFSVDQIWVPRFAKWCLPIVNYIPDEETKALSQYAMRTCYYEDSLVAAPLYLDIGVMYYRKDLIGALSDGEYWSNQLSHSITWQDLLKLGREMKHGDRPFFTFQAAPYEGLIVYLLGTSCQHEGTSGAS